MIVRWIGALMRLENGVAGDEFVGAFADVEHQKHVLALKMSDALFVFGEIFPLRVEGRMRVVGGRAAGDYLGLALILRKPIRRAARNIKCVIVFEAISLAVELHIYRALPAK